MPAARRSFTAESTERRIEEGGYSQAVNGLLLDKQLGGLEFANCITSSRLAIPVSSFTSMKIAAVAPILEASLLIPESPNESITMIGRFDSKTPPSNDVKSSPIITKDSVTGMLGAKPSSRATARMRDVSVISIGPE